MADELPVCWALPLSWFQTVAEMAGVVAAAVTVAVAVAERSARSSSCSMAGVYRNRRTVRFARRFGNQRKCNTMRLIPGGPQGGELVRNRTRLRTPLTLSKQRFGNFGRSAQTGVQAITRACDDPRAACN